MRLKHIVARAAALSTVVAVGAIGTAPLHAAEAPSSAPAAGDAVTLKLQSRKPTQAGDYAPTHVEQSWKPAETCVIVCDMWDAHHCLNAVRRAEEMAPRMDAYLKAARDRGILVIHAPSSCMAAYADHPGRKLAQSAPAAGNLPTDISEWCRHIPAEDAGEYPIDQTDGGEDDDPAEHEAWAQKLAGMGRNPKAPWVKQMDALTIAPGDAISDSGVEIWNLLESRGIKNVMLLGVHTNMCVLGRPFGLRQMAKNGKNVVLVRDLTDTMYNPAKRPFVSHFAGTQLIIEHIEKFVCPTITSTALLGGERFRFKGDTTIAP
jgi:nicotinamidase-related amidase